MATDAQIAANILNSLKSTGPTSQAGREASSKNSTKHGLSAYDNATFFIMPEENMEKYEALKAKLLDEHKPSSETEHLIVRRLAQHDWLRARAIRLQQSCMPSDHHMEATGHFALYLRYQVTQERAFYKALNELQKYRAERRKAKIGFDSQKLKEAAAERANQALQLKKDEFELKKIRLEMNLLAREAATQGKKPVAVPKSDAENGPSGAKIAA
jgi:hypothetical protein